MTAVDRPDNGQDEGRSWPCVFDYDGRECIRVGHEHASGRAGAGEQRREQVAHCVTTGLDSDVCFGSCCCPPTAQEHLARAITDHREAVERVIAEHLPFRDGPDSLGCTGGGCQHVEWEPAHVADELLALLGGTQPGGDALDAAHFERQRTWSREAFGPGPWTNGVLDHIRKELTEIEDAPTDLSEWVDVAILAFDGAWRAGHEPQAIIDAVRAKQARNEARVWPDWRTADPDKAIEHDRTADASPCHVYSHGASGWHCAVQGPHGDGEHTNAAGDVRW